MKDPCKSIHEIAVAYCEGLSGAELYRQASLVARYDIAISRLRARIVSVIETRDECERFCERKGTRHGQNARRRSPPPERILSTGNDAAHSCCEPHKVAHHEPADDDLEPIVEALPHIGIFSRLEQSLWMQRSRAVRRLSTLRKAAAESKESEPKGDRALR